MESIENENGNTSILALGPEHLAGCLALSKSANWNQNEADWRLMLGFGRGWGVSMADGSLAASTLVLPYGANFAWVAMVLVLPEHRRKGYATQLLRTALAALKREGRTPILDATPAGHEVYVQEGFRDTWAFRRFSLSRNSRAPAAKEEEIRNIEKSDWPRILELDAEAFGASRETVLRDLAARRPQAALLAEADGMLAGFVLGREGREASQIGPLVARDADIATSLLAVALTRIPPPVYIDLVDREAALQSWLLARGFEFQRPFTRMVRGVGSEPARAPGDAALVFCPAGPELG